MITENHRPNGIQLNKSDKLFLTEKIFIKKLPEFSDLCHKAKNLYNHANFLLRKRYFFLLNPKRIDLDLSKESSATKKYLILKKKLTDVFNHVSGRQGYGGIGKFMYYDELWNLLKYCPVYKVLPSQTAQQVLKFLERNWKSYFKLKEAYHKAKINLSYDEFRKKFKAKPKIPGYKKPNGEITIVFTNQQCRILDGYLKFPKKGLSKNLPYWLPPIKTRLRDKLHQVRVVPKGIGYNIEIVYQKKILDLELNKGHIGAIDIGVNNIVTFVNNIGSKPIIIKGGIIKSINQYYNKERSRLSSIKDKQGINSWTKKLAKLDLIRSNKINDCFHKISRVIIKDCIKNNIGTIVIGYNKGWKQRINIGRKNNQNFVSIPFLNLINKIKYKGTLIGLEVIFVEESHTSKCSFLDSEQIRHHNHYKGQRISRGLYKSLNGRIINADVNGAFNILKKAFPNAISADGIEDDALHPCPLIWNS